MSKFTTGIAFFTKHTIVSRGVEPDVSIVSLIIFIIIIIVPVMILMIIITVSVVVTRIITIIPIVIVSTKSISYTIVDVRSCVNVIERKGANAISV